MHIDIRSREYHGKKQTFSNYPPFENDANFGNYPNAADVIERYNRSRKITPSKYNIFATSPLSRSASIRVHVEVPTDEEGRRALEPPPEDLYALEPAPRRLLRVSFVQALQTSSKTKTNAPALQVRQEQIKRSIVCHRKLPSISKYRLEMMPTLQIIQALQTLRCNQDLRSSSSTCGIFATSCLSRSASVRVHVNVWNGHGRARGVGAAP